MRRYDGKSSRNRKDLDARLDALGGRSSRSPRKGPRRRKSRSNAGPAVLGLIVIVVILAAIYLIVSSGSGDSGQADKPVRIEVVKGDTLSSVADRLEEKDVIGSAFFFKLQARFGGESDALKPGKYSFERGEDGDVILGKLTRGEAVPTFAVTVPEGLTLDQTADAVANGKGGISKQAFLKAANGKDYDYAFLKDPAIKNTEGFLFPKSYEFERGTSADQVVDRLLNQYLLETQDIDLEGAEEKLNLSEYELLTAASLIEREAANDQERAVIASVIYNRMREGMPLQIDATIQYARGKPKENLSIQDLEIDSPYNTYKQQGLPPGPICSPSRASIEAAANPEQTNYLYYVLKPGGKGHFFTNNYNEFLQAKQDAGL